MMALLHSIKLRAWVRPCRGCDDWSVHDSHLTWLGRRKFT